MSIGLIAVVEVLAVLLVVWWVRRLGRGYSPDLPANWTPSDRLRRSEDRTMRQIRG